MAKTQYYVVWRGRKRGVFSSWPECERQVKGYAGAEYKGFDTLQDARAAFEGSYEDYRGRASSSGKWLTAKSKPRIPSVCVDAACSGSPGRLEYRGVHTATGQQLFRVGPLLAGTNNVGEFLAVVEAFRWLMDRELDWPVYSDSDNAIGWIRHGKCNTKLKLTAANRRLFDMIRRAEHDLHLWAIADGAHRDSRRPTVLKWATSTWGENPADFGRK